jgi:FkbM family methyltransferase
MSDPAILNSLEMVPKQAHFAQSLCDKKRIAIQAGGHRGAAPLELIKYFDVVYTYEPDITNFKILVGAIGYHRIIPTFGVLCDSHGTGGLQNNSKNNSGDFRSKPNGDIPRHKIDDLKFDSCDLIWLDVQGDEYVALEGGRDTVQECAPIIGIESKNSQPAPKVEEYLDRHGYIFVGSVGLDMFYKWAGK